MVSYLPLNIVTSKKVGASISSLFVFVVVVFWTRKSLLILRSVTVKVILTLN
jgi:hypothetical protein